MGSHHGDGDVGMGRSAAGGGVGDGGGFGRPVGVVLQLQGQVHVEHPGGLVPPTEQPREEGRAPAYVGLLGTRKV